MAPTSNTSKTLWYASIVMAWMLSSSRIVLTSAFPIRSHACVSSTSVDSMTSTLMRIRPYKRRIEITSSTRLHFGLTESFALLESSEAMAFVSTDLMQNVFDRVVAFWNQLDETTQSTLQSLRLPVAVLVGFGLWKALVPPSQLIDSETLDEIVDSTFLQGKDLQCVYKASRDGWSALNFHDSVDNQGSGIVVARTLTGQVFGGYNPAGWRSTDDYYSSTGAFLWSTTTGKSVSKFPVLGRGDAAIFDYATAGPCFGSADLQIGPPRAAILGGFAGPDAEDLAQSAGSLRSAKSSPGLSYNTSRQWPVRGNLQLVEVEVYCAAART